MDWRVPTLGMLLGLAVSSGAAAQEDKAGWRAPFGFFNANFTVASEYTYAGISNTQRQPAVQAGLDYRTVDLIDAFPLWLFLGTWGSNVSFPASGPGMEVDLFGGAKMRLLERRLKIELAYYRYTYPGYPAELGYEYGDIGLDVDYDFGPARLAGRVRFSPNSFGHSGHSWNKRALLSVPLPFLKLDEVKFKAYGALGNIWVENFLAYGLPSNDYWYWQTGLVTSVFGLDFTLAYTDTSISPEGCAFTNYCSGRAFLSVTKVF